MSLNLRFDREWRTGWAFALPGLSLLAIVMGFPLVYAAVMAVSSLTLMHPPSCPPLLHARYGASQLLWGL